MSSSIDTLSLYERFKAAKLQDAAAKEVAEAIKESVDFVQKYQEQELVTKKDLEATKKDLELGFELGLAKTKADLLKWIIGLMIAQGGLIVALVKLL